MIGQSTGRSLLREMFFINNNLSDVGRHLVLSVHPCGVVDQFLMKSDTGDEIHVCEEHHVGRRVVQGEVPQDVHWPVHLQYINQSLNTSIQYTCSQSINPSVN